MELGFGTYGLIRLLGRNDLNVVSRPHIRRWSYFWDFITLLDWSHGFGHESWPCLSKLELGFWNYGLVRLLGPSGPSVASRPQTSRSWSFLRFHNFVSFMLWFWWKRGPAVKFGNNFPDLWLDMYSGPN